MKKKIKGIWFYGYSGSGKSFASQYLFKIIKDSVVLDGDDIRKNISWDLSYDQKSRETQIKRVAGLCNIILKSKKFPIASTVWMNSKILNQLNKNNIIVIKIERDLEEMKINNKTYDNKKNVVGVDIFFKKLNTKIITNSGNKKFYTILKSLIN